MDRAADLRTEDAVDHLVLLDPVLPANAGETTVARKWSPPPVQSSTSALAPGMAVSIRCLISSAVGIEMKGSERYSF
jgi:hypothetical protein